MLDATEKPRNARSRRTRAALLDAARALLEEQGTESLTMATVAERAGISRRAVYLHFASRTELLTELFGYVSEQEGLASSLEPVWAASVTEPSKAFGAVFQRSPRRAPGLKAAAVGPGTRTHTSGSTSPTVGEMGPAAGHRRNDCPHDGPVQAGDCGRMMSREVW